MNTLAQEEYILLLYIEKIDYSSRTSESRNGLGDNFRRQFFVGIHIF